MTDKRNIIAKNIARMLQDGDFVNLGVGIPTLVGNYLPEGVRVILHGENGSAGLDSELAFDGIYDSAGTLRRWQAEHKGGHSNYREGHKDLVNAGGNAATLVAGASCFDSCVSFAIARGGHLDMTVLGGLQIDEEGNLANWMVPGKRVNGMGGAMDLVAGAKTVVVAMEHCARDGSPKILRRCTLPLTAASCVSIVVTEYCVIRVGESGLLVTAMVPGTTREQLQGMTEAKLSFAGDMAEMEV